jgi:FlaA1/EpsC-like NDP-sugar epimerase
VFLALEHMQGGEIFVLKMKNVKRITDFAHEVINKFAGGKKIRIKLIGLRPGERLHELLLTEEESRHTIEIKNMFVILPTLLSDFGVMFNLKKYPGAKKVPISSYSSR